MTYLRSDRVFFAAFGVSTVFAALSACSASNATLAPKGHAGSAGAAATAGTLPGTAGAGTAGAGTAGAGTAGAGTAGAGTAGAGTAGAGTAGAGTAGAGTAGAGTAGAGTAGTGGSAYVPTPLCTTKIAAASTQIATFETYDGTVTADKYGWDFGGATNGTAGVHAGAYSFADCNHMTEPTCTSGIPVMSILAGHSGNYGLTENVTTASRWGEGLGFFLLDSGYHPACLNASTYTGGITLWVRGSVPTNTFSVSVSMAQSTMPDTSTTPTSGGTCTGTLTAACASPTASDLPISTTWTQVNIPWAQFIKGASGATTQACMTGTDCASGVCAPPNGMDGTVCAQGGCVCGTPLAANGDNITGFSFGANLTYAPIADGSATYGPVAGDISIAIDDMAFIP